MTGQEVPSSDEEAQGTSSEGVGDSDGDSFDQHPADHGVLDRREDAEPDANQRMEEGRGAARRRDASSRHFESLSYTQTEEYKLSIPPPDWLAAYEQVAPGSVERIIRMAEAETYRDHDRDDRQVETAAKLMQRGQWIAAAIAGSGLLGAASFFALGNNVAGSVFLGVPVIMLVRQFTPR